MGDDIFIIDMIAGDTTITDFQAGEGTEDIVDLSAFGITGLATLIREVSDFNSGINFVLAGDTSLTLLGVNRADFHEADFLFA